MRASPKCIEGSWKKNLPALMQTQATTMFEMQRIKDFKILRLCIGLFTIVFLNISNSRDSHVHFPIVDTLI
jgi:hypothetical protein